VVDEALHRVASARHAGLISAAKRGASLKVLKDLASTPVERAFNLLTSTPTKSLSSFTESHSGREGGQPRKKPQDASRAELEAIYSKKKAGNA
jgi:hypothetical protein